MQPLISLAVITGNVGGAMMNRFLDHFQTIADEIIVVRAIGNQEPDDSLDTAKARGFIIGEYQNKRHEWAHVDDFAAARNQAWKMASGQWVMWADLDDIISKDGAKALRAMVEQHGDKFDMLACPYLVPDQGMTDNMRERVVRRGIARWIQPVHECLEPIQPEMKWRTAVCMEARFVHDPGRKAPPARHGRNLRILNAVPEEEMTTSLRYYKFAENFASGNIEEGVKAAYAFLQLPNAGRTERFECALSLSMVTEDPKLKAQWLQLCYHECPERREPLVLLSNIEQMQGNIDNAEAYLRAASALPLPKNAPWNLRRKMWGWLFVQEQARIERARGNFAKADALELNHFVQNGGRISLLHATRGRAQQALEMRNVWLERADNPDAVEHIFGLDPDDEAEGSKLGGFRHIVQDPDGGPCGAWNMAASIAHGEVLVQVSDDMVPPQGWDRLILEAIGDTTQPKVLRVSDGHRSDGLIVLAIVTRAWVRQQGYLFHPAFFSMYSDNWLTECAEKAGAIIEAPHLVFEHQHPVFTGEQMHATTSRSNRLLNYATGKKVLEQLRSGVQPFTWKNIEGLSHDQSPIALHERIIASLPEHATCVEVGVAKGKGIAAIKTMCDFRNIRAIGYDHFSGTAGEGVDYPENMESQCRANAMLCFGHDAYIEKLESVRASQCWPDNRIEYVYLDAAHDYESVKRDIAAWWPKVRPGGWLAGHDYIYSEGVKRAVDEAFSDAEKVGECWLIQKK